MKDKIWNKKSKNTIIKLWTSGGCLYIGENNNKSFACEIKDCDVYTEFAIQKLNWE